jgi:hypothetical protein
MTTPWTGWASGFVDLDNDGNKDLWLANGHVYPKADSLGTTSYLQPIAVLANRQGKFERMQNIFDTQAKASFRGGCAGDFNNDGRIDLVVLPISGAPLLFENSTRLQAHWLGITLRGHAGNRDGIGAQIRLESCGTNQFEIARNGGSYISGDDPRIHFGLGSCSVVDRLTIQWPGGHQQTLTHLPADRYLTIDEPL